MSEHANKRTRGPFIITIFVMQGFRILVGGVFAITVSAVFKARYPAPSYEDSPLGLTVHQADYIWRIILIFGAFTAALTYYWRTKMPERARYTALVEKNAEKAEKAAAYMARVMQVDIEAEQEKVEQIEDKESNSFSLFSKEFIRRHGIHLLGTTTTWFLLDIAFYSQNPIFAARCLGTGSPWLLSIRREDSLFSDGIYMMTIFMFALAIPYDHCTHKANRIGFVVMYSTFFFANFRPNATTNNFGPNATTFVVPAEIFQARFRSTCHGISAASGKLGALLWVLSVSCIWHRTMTRPWLIQDILQALGLRIRSPY